MSFGFGIVIVAERPSFENRSSGGGYIASFELRQGIREAARASGLGTLNKMSNRFGSDAIVRDDRWACLSHTRGTVSAVVVVRMPYWIASRPGSRSELPLGAQSIHSQQVKALARGIAHETEA